MLGQKVQNPNAVTDTKVPTVFSRANGIDTPRISQDVTRVTSAEPADAQLTNIVSTSSFSSG